MAVLTLKNYINNIDNFINQVTVGMKSYYVYVGKPDPWLNASGLNIDSTPPAANISVLDSELKIYDDLVYGKEITSADITHMIPRYNWASGDVYSSYDQSDKDLYTKRYFVAVQANDTYDVYKCIFNNYGGLSTVKPDLPSTSSVFKTSDGYVWKFMFSVDGTADVKFTTADYIPITPDLEVKSNAVNGSIDYIRVDTAGTGYKGHHRGYLNGYISNQIVQLANNASGATNYYKNSSIYLKAGFGAGQIRKIASYNGTTKQVTTLEAFKSFVYMNIGSIVGGDNIITGLTVTQNVESIGVNYFKGFVNPGDTIIQTDTNPVVTGEVATSNQTVVSVIKYSAGNFVTNRPLYNTNQSGTLKTGLVNITSSCTVITAFSGVADFTTLYSAGDYIRVGNYQSNNIRRVVTSASSSITVDSPFLNTLVANVHYIMPSAVNPTSINHLKANGVITDTNLNGKQLEISNPSNLGINYFVGERVDVVDSLNQSQSANGIVVYANSTTVILDSVQGVEGNWTNDYFLLGSSSLLKTSINYVTSGSSVTLGNINGKFIPGQKVFFRPTADITQQVANAIVLSSYITPNELTEYIVSPTVNIVGDGTNAIAYSAVNATSNSIQGIEIINPGFGYTYANISLSSNGGSGAILTPIVAPIRGHGYDANTELAARYAGVSVTFNDIETETYKFPGYGSYRKVGIIENPLFEDVTVTLDKFDRAKLDIENRIDLFEKGEVVIQSMNSGVGIVVFSNSTFMEIKNVGGGEWINDDADDDILGLNSGATANVVTYSPTYFTLGAAVEVVSEVTSGATGEIEQVFEEDPYTIRLTNVSGKFTNNDTVVDYATNTYATVAQIYTANGTTEVTSVFGNRINQTARLTLSTQYGAFQQNETVIQEVSNAVAKVLDSTKELDLTFNYATGSFFPGETVTSELEAQTKGHGIVLWANNSYLKLTGVSGIIDSGDTILNTSDSATVQETYQVLVLNDVNGKNRFQVSSNVITGQTSRANGVATIANTITYPDLIRESGNVLYLENIQPFTRSNTSKEEIRLIIKF